MTSIIIPAYNAGKYLSEAIESIISQSDSDWELILIDDGSTDSTPEICDKAASTDSRIRVIHSRNKGVSAARNAGLDLAKGDFLTFLDADDKYHPDFLKLLKDAVYSTGARIAAAPFTSSKKNNKISHCKSQHCLTIPTQEAISYLLYQTTLKDTGKILDTSIWNKLYARELWKDIRFNEDIRYEDLDIFYRLLLKTDFIAFVPCPLYYYRQHESSFIHKFSKSRLDVLDVTDRMVRNLSDSKLDIQPSILLAARTRRFAAHCNIYLLLLRNGRPDKEAEKRCLNLIRMERKMVLRNSHARFKDRIGALLARLLF